MIHESLNNQNTYQKLNKNVNPTIMTKLKETIKQPQKYFHR